MQYGEYPIESKEFLEVFKPLISDTDVVNATYEFHPFWMGDCTCGYAEKEDEWTILHDGLSAHEKSDAWAEFAKENDHTKDCREEMPNFKYGDLEIRWVKIPFNHAYSNRPVSITEFRHIIKKCQGVA